MRRTPLAMRRRIFAALDRLAADPRSGDILKLHGAARDEWRLRVGEWRVRFAYTAEERTLVVTRVLPRGRAYRE